MDSWSKQQMEKLTVKLRSVLSRPFLRESGLSVPLADDECFPSSAVPLSGISACCDWRFCRCGLPHTGQTRCVMTVGDSVCVSSALPSTGSFLQLQQLSDSLSSANTAMLPGTAAADGLIDFVATGLATGLWLGELSDESLWSLSFPSRPWPLLLTAGIITSCLLLLRTVSWYSHMAWICSSREPKSANICSHFSSSSAFDSLMAFSTVIHVFKMVS